MLMPPILKKMKFLFRILLILSVLIKTPHKYFLSFTLRDILLKMLINNHWGYANFYFSVKGYVSKKRWGTAALVELKELPSALPNYGEFIN